MADVGELFDVPLEGYDFVAKAESKDNNIVASWGTSVMVMDCSKLRFDLDQIYQEIDQGLYSYRDFSRFTPKFLAIHPYRLGELDPRWNEFDRADSQTRLIHYTQLYTQPWKYTAHPYGRIWFSYFRQARNAGFITKADVALTIRRGYVRMNLSQGNSPRFVDKLKFILKRWKEGESMIHSGA